MLWLICDFNIQNTLTENNVDPDQTPPSGRRREKKAISVYKKKIFYCKTPAF